jgi:hypothetical protein
VRACRPIPPSVIGGQRYAFIRSDAATLGPRFPLSPACARLLAASGIDPSADERRPIGIVSSTDLLAALARDNE